MDLCTLVAGHWPCVYTKSEEILTHWPCYNGLSSEDMLLVTLEVAGMCQCLCDTVDLLTHAHTHCDKFATKK